MEYLVCRTQALENTRTGRINTSQMWPTIVNALDHEDAVHQVFREHFGTNYTGHLPKSFLVVAMINAVTVTFKPKSGYTVEVSPAHYE